MSLVELFFIILFILLVVYIALGNYLYWVKILPVLNEHGGNEHPIALPGQFKQIDTYISILNKNKSKPWFYFYLKHIRMISFVLFVLVISLILSVFFLLLFNF